MASNARCFFLVFLALSFSFQTHARDSKFFTKESISVSPIQAPTLAPAPSPEPKFIEHGYGLYGHDLYENYEHPKATPQSNSMEFEKAYFNDNFNGNNGYVPEKQGMSDTRFLENGKYFYDVNNDKEENVHLNNENFEQEKQGLSDTRFLENSKYFYDDNSEEKEANKEGNFGEFDVHNLQNENENKNENENENEKYFYDAYNDNENKNYYNSNNNNNEFVHRYNGNGNNNEYETQGRRDGYNYNHDEYNAKEGRGVYNYPKKFPKYEYDTMEEYDRGQGLH